MRAREIKKKTEKDRKRENGEKKKIRCKEIEKNIEEVGEKESEGAF